MSEQKVMDEIVPVLKNYLNLSKKDSEETKDTIKELKEAIKRIDDCNVSLKINVEKLKTSIDSFNDSYKERGEACDKKHERYEEKFDSIPSKEIMSLRDQKVDNLETKLDKLIPTLYKIVGAAGLFPTIIVLVGWFLKSKNII